MRYNTKDASYKYIYDDKLDRQPIFVLCLVPCSSMWNVNEVNHLCICLKIVYVSQCCPNALDLPPE